MRELRADFQVAREWFVVAVANDRPVAYGYSLPLNVATWQSAASARRAYFDALPDRELAAIKAASVDDPAAFLIVGTVYLEGHASADGAVRLATFTNRHVRAPSVTHSHFLLPHGSPFVPTAESLGIHRRLTEIGLQAGEPPVDEWVLDYGDRGFHEVIAERLGLPRTTFYRRLRHGLRLLASRLRVEAALASSGGSELRAE